MEVLFVVLFCVMLFLFMRGVGSILGASFGTAAGVGCLGLMGFGVICFLVIVLLPFLLPCAIFVLACYVIIRLACGFSSKED